MSSFFPTLDHTLASPITTTIVSWNMGDSFGIFKNKLSYKQGIEIAEEMANEMQDVIKENPHWKKSESGVREIKQKLIKVILESGEKDIKKVTEITNKIVKILQEEKA